MGNNAAHCCLDAHEPLWWEHPDPERALALYLADRDNPYDRWKSRSVWRLIPRCQPGENRLLDYGCGGGEFAVRLAELGWEVSAADASPYSLAACRLHAERRRVTAHMDFVHTAPPDYWQSLDGQLFDLILAKDVIEHIQDDIAFLNQIKSHLAPHGTAVIVTQNDQSWNYRLEAPYRIAENPTWCGWDPTHVRFYNKPTLHGKLLHVGLRPVSWRAAYLIPYKAWQSRFGYAVKTLIRQTTGLGMFHLPEAILGGISPFNRWGWSIAVKCRHA